jgi:methylmalonyl-CoA/ethylmalonyl-CoA epimerase
MRVTRVDHIAIVVQNLDEALDVYRDRLGMEVAHTETIAGQDVKIGFLPVGDSALELLEPINEESGIGRYLARRGEGLHHICLEVENIEETMAEFKAAGLQLIDERPRQGANGKIAFIHPKSAHGVLIELLQRE